jgi:GMP synthase-like glutamine amidotransferase
MIRVHYIEHVPFETPGYILQWAKEKGHTISSTKIHKNESLPDTDSFDFLIIMGGPMGVYDELIHPWLIDEKLFVKEAISCNKIVLGICLGSQLIADVLDAKVYPNKHKEIGFFPISFSTEIKHNAVFEGMPKTQNVFHWHGDTFDLPHGATLIASSDACVNQAFTYKKKVVGLQFHLEVTEDILRGLLEHGKNEIVPAPYIQSMDIITKQIDNLKLCHEMMEKLLDKLSTL